MMGESKRLNSHLRSHSPISYISSSSEDDVALSADLRLHPKTKAKTNFLLPSVDPSVVTEIEEQAKHASKSIEKMMNYLSKELKNACETTSGIVNVYDGTIDHVHIEVEKNIKAMYGLIAKCEELDRKMKPINELANQVENIKSTIDTLESICK